MTLGIDDRALDKFIEADMDFQRHPEPPEPDEEAGFIPIILLVIFGLAAGFVVGVKVQDKIVHDTEICHRPGPSYFESMSVPTTAASTVEILDFGGDGQ